MKQTAKLLDNRGAVVQFNSGTNMKSFSVSIKTKPSGLWFLEEKEILHYILAPAMDYARQNGLHITAFNFVDSVLDIYFRGAPDMLPSFLRMFGNYIEYALSRLRPEDPTEAYSELPGIIEHLPPEIPDVTKTAGPPLNPPPFDYPDLNTLFLITSAPP